MMAIKVHDGQQGSEILLTPQNQHRKKKIFFISASLTVFKRKKKSVQNSQRTPAVFNTLGQKHYRHKLTVHVHHKPSVTKT